MRFFPLILTLLFAPPAFSLGLFSRNLVNQEYGDNSGGSTGATSSRATDSGSYYGGAGPVAGAASSGPYQNPGGSCSVGCTGSGTVKVDVTAHCMCISGVECFKVDIGKHGPAMTTEGTGTIGGHVRGARYQTLPWSQTKNGVHDQDALSMGIPANDGLGKWIHKTRGCTPGGQDRTLGCIGVPCDHWTQIKSQIGKSLEVCNGGGKTYRRRYSPTRGRTGNQ